MKLRHALIALALAGCGSKEAAKSESAPEAVQNDPAPKPKGDPLPALSDNAPTDKPTAMNAAVEKRVAEISSEAMKTYPDAKARYLKGLPSGEHFFVITTLTSPGTKESVFVSVNGITEGKVAGTIASEIMNVTGYKAGDAYTLPEGAITDWLITKPDGSEEGNAVGKYLDTIH